MTSIYYIWCASPPHMRDVRPYASPRGLSRVPARKIPAAKASNINGQNSDKNKKPQNRT